MGKTIRMFVLTVSACTLMMVFEVGAKDKLIARPWKMMVQSQMVINLADFSYTAHAEGVVSHFGISTMEGWGNLTEPISNGTITAANGDFVEWEGNQNTPGVYTITGGIGRFEGATGEFTAVVELVSQVIDPIANTMTNSYIWIASGTIAY